MSSTAVFAVFDIGKTNKKLLLFDTDNNLVYEINEELPETTDEDGFPCEDINLLETWLNDKWQQLLNNNKYLVRAVNFTTYGASLVHLDKNDQKVTPLYNYLKPVNQNIIETFYRKHRGKESLCLSTASPAMGMLNSGFQLYWLKYYKPELFSKIAYTLHFPQYISFLFSKQKKSGNTSIGCHTALWDYTKKDYHRWVYDEQLINLFPPIQTEVFNGFAENSSYAIPVGTGLHDSSAALIPYMHKFKQSFILISTGTWCITLNPFDHSPLSIDALNHDCLNYLTPEGNPVKASRIFFGQEFNHQIEKLNKHFNKPAKYYQELKFTPALINQFIERHKNFENPHYKLIAECMEGTGPYSQKPQGAWDVSLFKTFEEAYFQLMVDLTCMLKTSVRLAENQCNISHYYIDGGFSKNPIFMNLMATHFPNVRVISSTLHQATALGAVLRLCTTDLSNKNISSWEFSETHPCDELLPLLNDYYKMYYFDY